eukprot:scaffold66811_cov30-Tisochrysis_lutea.AAC.4
MVGTREGVMIQATTAESAMSELADAPSASEGIRLSTLSSVPSWSTIAPNTSSSTVGSGGGPPSSMTAEFARQPSRVCGRRRVRSGCVIAPPPSPSVRSSGGPPAGECPPSIMVAAVERSGGREREPRWCVGSSEEPGSRVRLERSGAGRKSAARHSADAPPANPSSKRRHAGAPSLADIAAEIDPTSLANLLHPFATLLIVDAPLSQRASPLLSSHPLLSLSLLSSSRLRVVIT